MDFGLRHHSSLGKESTIEVYSADVETNSIHDLRTSETTGAISPQLNGSCLTFPADSTLDIPLQITDGGIFQKSDYKLSFDAIETPHVTSSQPTKPENQAFRRKWGDFARQSLRRLDGLESVKCS